MKVQLVLLAGWLAAATTATTAAETAPAPPEPSWSGVATNARGEVLAKITVDTAEVPDLDGWGRRAGELCVEWYPKMVTLLASDGFTPAGTVQVRFRKDMKGVAATGRNVISVSANYVRGHTNDWGMVIHELTHVVQAYPPGSGPGWLVEGVADYIRLTHFEPQARPPRINPDKASYRDAYKTTAVFLAWVEKNHDPQAVRKLNAALRERKFKLELFKDYTGQTVDELWKDFADSLREKSKAAAIKTAP